MARLWIWTAQKERAAQLLAERLRSQRQVAELIGVTRRTVEGWVRRPVFRERVAQERVAYLARVRAERAARLGAQRAAERAREHEEEAAFQRRLAVIAELPLAQRPRAMRALMRHLRDW